MMLRLSILFVLSAGLAGCSAIGQYFPDFEPTGDTMVSAPSTSTAPTRSTAPPAMPGPTGQVGTPDAGMLMACRGHVLVPAMGMTFVPAGGRVPPSGQYLREESLTPPYRVLPPGAFVTQDYNPGRLNIDLDRNDRIINLRCG